MTTAELPLAPVIGTHAFYGCSKLNTITMYYGETVLKSIGEDAFWRETDSGDTLYIASVSYTHLFLRPFPGNRPGKDKHE